MAETLPALPGGSMIPQTKPDIVEVSVSMVPAAEENGSTPFSEDGHNGAS
jgi:hypothetical protein